MRPPSRYTFGFVYVVGIVFSGIFVWLYAGSLAGVAADRARFQWPGLALMLGMVLLALGGILFALRRQALIVTDTALTVRTGFYGRVIPRSSLNLAAAIEGSLLERAEFTPRWRTNGIGLPGFRAGWFRLRDGTKALVFLTDPFRITYLPTNLGYVLLLSTDGLLDALREPAALTPAPTDAPPERDG
ncbi:MAG: PH domain-containing protein [Betaproteobacteria bacterium]